MPTARGRDAWPARFHWLSCTLLLLVVLAQPALFCVSLRTFASLRDSFPSAAGQAEQPTGKHAWQRSAVPAAHVEIDDEHPIRALMHHADRDFDQYNRSRSRTFKHTVDQYRRRYGRHPPPDFDKWYQFARKREVYHIDDFQQIHDDLRPFWAVAPAELRRYAQHAGDINRKGTATLSIRNGRVVETGRCGWRSEDFINMLQSVARYLPDMDLAMNRMDQPRLVVPWDEIQAALEIEEATRSLHEDGVVNRFTTGAPGSWLSKPWYLLPEWLGRFVPFLQQHDERDKRQIDLAPNYGWFSHTNKPFMDLVSKACPPESHARNVDSRQHTELAELRYKQPLGGFIVNFNLSSDLCTAGPELEHLHGLLYASTSMTVSHKLFPIFSECKTNVNNDILIPATIYHKGDEHYRYSQEKDVPWDNKNDVLFWRGSTSGGTARQEKPQLWRSMHRQRLVLMTNGTTTTSNTTSILALPEGAINVYASHRFSPAAFAADHTDIEFTNKIACVPNCSFYDDTFSISKWTPFSEAFKYKYLIDVDGHSFSGRWRAYLQSRSLGFKATIIREWHDTRLWAWKHFVPVDNRYDDLYSLLTYFMGYTSAPTSEHPGITVPRHDYEAFKIAQQGHDWAARVLRKEDIEVYLYRLLLEYARLVDDNRDRIGYLGDGGTEMEEFDRRHPAVD